MKRLGQAEARMRIEPGTDPRIGDEEVPQSRAR